MNCNKTDPESSLAVQHGTLNLLILHSLEAEGALHGYGIARSIEQLSGHRLSLNSGTVHPVLGRLVRQRFVAARWGQSANNRKAKYYTITEKGRAELAREARRWKQTAELMDSFLRRIESL